jgi:predicted nuclease of predicted toxin-antitoxin system
MLKGSPPKVLLLEFGNISNRELIWLFDLRLEEVISAFEDGHEFVIFRRDEVIGY